MSSHRFSPLLLLLSALFAGASATLAQTSAPWHLTGVVLSQGTNVPVPRCHLSMRLEQEGADRRRRVAPDQTPAADSDAGGRFSIDLPSDGSWELSASAKGFRTQLLNEHEGYSSAVVLHAGQSAPSLVVHLEPDSSISGIVRDEAGEAVRNAVLSLQLASAQPSPGARRARATTDDRGHFELDGVAPGSYKLSVQATPWYSSGAGHPGSGDTATGTRDPVFDVVYPVTWYPGVFEPETAGVLDLHGGEALQVSFNLLPVPAAHLRLAEPASSSAVPVSMPTIERVESGQLTGLFSQLNNASGPLDFGSLAPGLYRIAAPSADGRSTTAFVHLNAGATVSLASADAAGTADITFQISGDPHTSRSQINLTDLTSGVVFTRSSSDGFRRRSPPEISDGDAGAAPDRHLAVPAGSYQVTLAGDSDLYLTRMASKGKPLPGRLLTVPGGPSTVQLTVARGRARVLGHASISGKPIEGAMVMLVPTTFGQPGAIDLLRRDQTNTDGSFELTDVIPGDYILLAIDRGWNVNWHDPATLGRYLVNGIPLSLQPHSKATQELRALSP